MATTKSVYDPVKAIEGMFNGSVTRIGYALKAPADYGGSTKTVLAECAKKFHDALDDCEIQLLDAKWYLEHQLKTNRLRREAKEREMGTAAKRKHDEMKDLNEQNDIEQIAAKKAKIEQKPEQQETPEAVKLKEPAVEPKLAQGNGVTPIKKPPEPQITPNKAKPEVTEKPKDVTPKAQSTAQPSAQPKPQPKTQAREVPKPPAKDQPSQDDFAKPTPQATPTGTNDDFNFESMFGEPTNDLTGGNKGNNELDFDFGTEDLLGGADDTRNQDPDSLDSLLPGLESYANQTDDPFLNINTTTNDNSQNQNMPQSFSNDFGLPDLSTNDDFLNDDSLGGVGLGDGGNFEDTIDLSDVLLNLDFDSFQ